MQETWVPSLSREDPLEEGMAIHSSILAWSIPWAEEPGRLQSLESQRVRHERLHSNNVSRAGFIEEVTFVLDLQGLLTDSY